MKNHFFLGYLILSLSSSSFATSLLPQSLLNKFKHTHTNLQKRKIVEDDYVDFSGSWTGQCNDELESLDIQQDLESSTISINGENYYIDTISSESSNRNFEVANDITHLHWSDDGQQLLATVSSNYKEGNMSQGNFETHIGKMSWSLANKQLVIAYTLFEFIDGELQPQDLSGRCIYNKQD